MRKLTMARLLGIIGVITWAGTIFLRDTALVNASPWNFILGIMPNISAAWVIVFLIQSISNEKLKWEFTFKATIITSALLFVVALGSEIVHDLFLNSAFDIYDIIATAIALIIYLGAVYFIDNKGNIKNKGGKIYVDKSSR